jgi:hypothetical protein
MDFTRLLLVAPLLLAVTACQPGRYSQASFHLPAGGDFERGKVAFVSLGCNSCHEVSGVDAPRPTVQPAVPVVLGGEVEKKPSDAYLVTSIICPAYRLAPYPKDQITVNGQTRMPEYVDRISVRQLTDLTEFLQSRYVERRFPARAAYY